MHKGDDRGGQGTHYDTRVYSRHRLTEWDSYPLDKLLKCAYGKPMGLGKDAELIELRHAMRALIPSDLPIQKDGVVIIRPGTSAKWHTHTLSYAAAYCVDPGDPPAALLIGQYRVVPERGYMTIIRPDIPHAIERNEGHRDRVSFVLLVGADPRRKAIDT